MADESQISDETLEVLRQIPIQTLIDGLWAKGWPMSYVEGARPLQLGQKMAGRAVTLRFVPHRPDLAQDRPIGVDSAEYVAIELCGPGDAVVGDDDGVVIVPRSEVDDVIRTAHEREEVEEVIKKQLEVEKCSPGKYYPFNDLTWKLFEEKTGKSYRH